MSTKPKRIWSFSLRTLFVVTTILCLWLGWELSIVRQRRALRKEMEATQHYQFITAAAHSAMYAGTPPTPAASIFFVRQWLGDEPIHEIVYSYSPTGEAERAKLARVFPEAKLREILYEPCHPGCFPRGTLVPTEEGLRPIEQIVARDRVLVGYVDGAVMTDTVASVFRAQNRLWRIETDHGTLLTTSVQPLRLAGGGFRRAGDMVVGDQLQRSSDGKSQTATVLHAAPTEQVTEVFNLVLEHGDQFIADGFVVRCKPPPADSSSAAQDTALQHEH